MDTGDVLLVLTVACLLTLGILLIVSVGKEEREAKSANGAFCASLCAKDQVLCYKHYARMEIK